MRPIPPPRPPLRPGRGRVERGVGPHARTRPGDVAAIEPLVTLFDDSAGDELPLPPELLALHGPLRMAPRRDRPHVFTNFVASVDGLVAIDPPLGTGADVSRGDARDRAVMGLLRAVADAVVIGAGNLRAESDSVWTAERICPELASAYARLRAALGLARPPLQVVVTGSGDLDPGLPVFSGEAPAVVVTTSQGAARLASRPRAPRIAVAQAARRAIPLAAVLRAARAGPGARVLVESGPTSTAGFLAEEAVDELFLTRAPFLIGRGGGHVALGLVEGRFFEPGSLRARLVSARRGGDYLFLRYLLGAR